MGHKQWCLASCQYIKCNQVLVYGFEYSKII